MVHKCRNTVIAALVQCLLVLPTNSHAQQVPSDEELKALEQQIEKKEAKQTEEKNRSAAEAKERAEATRRLKEEQAMKEKRKQEEEAEKRAAAEAQRKAEEEKQRLLLEAKKKQQVDQFLGTADAAMKKKEYSVALQAYTQALAILPNDATALAGQARAREFQETCGALVGMWDWALGTTMIASADKSVRNLALVPNHGTWECTDPENRRFTLHWVLGGWVDTVTLSADGNKLDVVNYIGIHFQVERKDRQKTSPAPNPLYGR